MFIGNMCGMTIDIGSISHPARGKIVLDHVTFLFRTKEDICSHTNNGTDYAEAFPKCQEPLLPPQKRGNRRTPANLKRLKAHIQRLEGFGGTEANRQVLPFGIDEIDDRLPGGGLARGALHEVFAADAGIATVLRTAGRTVGKRCGERFGPVVRTSVDADAGALYGPALLQFGIDPARPILVRVRRDNDALWAMEEGLRCGQVAAVVGELGDIAHRQPAAAARRGRNRRHRPVAAFESRQTTAQRRCNPAIGCCHTRKDRPRANDNNDFLNTPPAPPGLGAARWQAELFRCRGGTSANWMMEWNDETGDLSVVAEIRNRPPVQLRQDWLDSPLGMIHETGGQLLLHAVNHTAEQAGIRAGMTLADAFAILPDLKTSEADIPAETKSLSRLADWCGRYTP